MVSLRSGVSPCACVFQLPVLGVKLYVFPIVGIIGGACFSCYNYFHVILNGGVGKNGSTVAVSPEHDHSAMLHRNNKAFQLGPDTHQTHKGVSTA